MNTKIPFGFQHERKAMPCKGEADGPFSLFTGQYQTHPITAFVFETSHSRLLYSHGHSLANEESREQPKSTVLFAKNDRMQQPVLELYQQKRQYHLTIAVYPH